MDWPAEHARAHRIIDAVLKACDPRPATARAAREQGLKPAPVLAIGKAAFRMAQGLEDVVGKPPARLIITTQNSPGAGEPDVFISDHPLPTERSLEAGSWVKAFIDASKAHGATGLTVLLSGGASALIAEPIPGITLDDYRTLTRLFLERGADIHRLNAIRRAVDALKGGALARYAAPLSVDLLVLSDVIGDALPDIGSGPFVPNTTNPRNTITLLTAFVSQDECPSVHAALRRLTAPTATPPLRTSRIVAHNAAAVHAACSILTNAGFACSEMQPLHGPPATEVANLMITWASGLKPKSALVWGGEWPYQLPPGVTGFGGRMQFIVASVARALDPAGQWAVLGVATDGVDGTPPPGRPPAAGAVITAGDAAALRTLLADSNASTALADSYRLWETLDRPRAPELRHHLFTGPTGTNVNDLLIAWRC